MDEAEGGPTTQMLVRAYKLLDRGDLEGLRGIYAEDVKMLKPDGPLTGIGEVIQYLQAIVIAFPDLTHQLLGSIENGDQAATQWRVRGTHSGPLAQAEGDLPPTGRTIDVTLAEFVHVEGGRITRSASYWDNQLFSSQLGLEQESEPR